MRTSASLSSTVRLPRTSRRRSALRAVALVAMTSALGVFTAGSAASAAVSGGRLVLLTQDAQFSHLDPARIYVGRDVAITSSFLFRTLVTYQPKAGSAGTTLVPDLATSTGSTPDFGKTWMFTLRAGSTFEDGSVIGCADIKYAVSRTFATTVLTDGPQYAIELLDIPKSGDGSSLYPGPYAANETETALFNAAVECSGDDRSITFHLARPRGDFNAALAYPAYSPVRAAADTRAAYDTAPQSSGPYKIASYQPGMSLELVRNTQWNRASDPVRQAYPDKVSVLFGVTTAATDQILLNDKFPNAASLDAMLPQDAVQFFGQSSSAGRGLVYQDPYVSYFAVNAKRLPCLAVRKALFFAWNTQAWIEAAGGTQYAGVPGDNYVKPAIGIDYTQTTGNIHDPNWSGWGNAAYAKTLLDQAKTDCPDVYNRVTTTGVFIDMRNNKLTQTFGPLLVDALAAAGIPAHLNMLGSNYWSVVRNPATQGDLSQAGWGPDWPNASTVLPNLLITGGSLNLSQNADDPAYPAFAALVDSATAEADRTVQSTRWHAAEQFAVDQYWATSFRFTRTTAAWGSAIGGAAAWDAWGTLNYGALTVDSSIPEGSLGSPLNFTVRGPGAVVTPWAVEYARFADAGGFDFRGWSQSGDDPSLKSTLPLSAGTWRIRAIPQDSSLPYAYHDYVATVDAQGAISVTDSGTPVAAVGGVYAFSLRTTNVAVRLLQGASPLTFAPGQSVVRGAYRWDATAQQWTWVDSGVNDATTAVSYLLFDSPGRYRVNVIPRGYTDLAATNSAEFWVKQDGTVWSDAAYSTPLTSPLDITLPIGNLLLHVNDPVTGSGLVSGAVVVADKTAWVQVTMGLLTDANAGDVALQLGDGSYALSVYPDSGGTSGGLAPREYALTVSGGRFVFDPVVSSSGGRYVVSPVLPNARFIVVSPVDTATQIGGDAQWCSAANVCVGGGAAVGSSAGVMLADGDYTVVVTPFGSSPFGIATYTAHVVAGVVSVDGLSIDNGVWRLPAGKPNLIGTIARVDGQPIAYAGLDAFFDVQVQYLDAQGNWNWMGVGRGTTDGTFALAVPQDGHFRALALPRGIPAVGSAFVEFSIKGGALFSADGSTPLTALSVQVPLANAKFKILDPITGSVLPVAGAGAYSTSPWTFIADASGSSGSGGVFGLALSPGTYRIFADPRTGNTSLVSQGYDVIVSDTGSVTVRLENTSTAIAADGAGVFTLTLKVMNAKFNIVSPTDSAVQLAGDVQWCLLKDGQETGCSGWGIGTSGWAQASIADGDYVVRVNPSSGSFGQAVYSGHVVSKAVSIDGLTIGSDGIWHLPAKSANVTGVLRDQAGAPLVFAAGQNVFVEAQRFENGGWQGIQTYRWVSQPSFAFALTPGQYRINARPYGFTDLGWGVTDTFYICTVGGQAYSTVGCTAGSEVPSVIATLRAANFKMRLIDPRDSSLLLYGWVSIIRDDFTTSTWVGNADLSGGVRGFTSALLDDGSYRLEVNAGGAAAFGLARRNYTLVVSGGGTTFALCPGTVYGCAQPIAATDGRFTMSPAKANVLGRVTMADGTPYSTGNNIWVNIALQKLNGNGGWDWVNWSGIDSSGFFFVSAADPGTYRLFLEPQGRIGAAATYSKTFEIVNDATVIDLGSVALRTPHLLIKVVEPGSTTGLQWLGIELRKDDQWLGWYGTGVLAVGALNFDGPGAYQVTVYPQQAQTDKGLTKRSYSVTVTLNADGTLAASIPDHAAVSGQVTLELGTANLSGRVLIPDGSAAVGNAQVVAVNALTNQEMWEFSTNSSITAAPALGKWAMNLPTGTYFIMARAPWGDARYGGSDRLGTITVDASGNATLSGALAGGSASNISIRLKAPTWTGTVLDPNGAALAYANVCFYDSVTWTCGTSNAQGEWALSGSTAFSADAVLEVSDSQNRYARLRAQGPDEIGRLLTPGAGNQLRLPSPNLRVHVTAGGVPAQYLWVNVEHMNVAWLGANSTNSAGVSAMFVDPAKLTSAVLRVRVDVYGTMAANYASTVKEFDCTKVSCNNTLEVALNSPNLRGVLRTPSGSAATNSWVEVFHETNAGRMWLNGANSDSKGYFSLYLPPADPGTTATYTIRANAPWNGDGSATSREFLVTVSDAGSVTTFRQTSDHGGGDVATELLDGVTRYSVRLSAPSVTGVVVTDGGVSARDSWVVAVDVTTGQWLWDRGMSSRANGSFGLDLPAGSYRIQAQQSWQFPDLAKSALCSITVSAGGVTGDAACVVAGAVRLNLRQPNVRLTLVDGAGNPVANAHVGIGFGSWWTDANSRSDGTVSLFIDGAAIADLNSQWLAPGSTVTPYVWVDPPWNSTDLVRWSCSAGEQKPLCDQIATLTAGAEYPGASSLGRISMLSSNTVITVIDPNTGLAVGPNAWVNLWQVTDTGSWNWIGGSNTNTSGKAAFYVPNPDDATVHYVLEVNPSWETRATYVMKRYGDGAPLAYAAVAGQSFALGTPNLTIAVNGLSGNANRWGWIQLEFWNGSGWQWLNGYSLDNLGTTGVVVPQNARIRLVANPGAGITGARTVCEFTTDALGAASVSACTGGGVTGSTLTLRLAAGNVVGTVRSQSSSLPVAGVIVVAELSDGTRITTASNDSGVFALSLDETKLWTLTFLPPNSSALASKVIANFAPSTDALSVQTVELA